MSNFEDQKWGNNWTDNFYENPHGRYEDSYNSKQPEVPKKEHLPAFGEIKAVKGSAKALRTKGHQNYKLAESVYSPGGSRKNKL